jgi:hypothetical protein
MQTRSLIPIVQPSIHPTRFPLDEAIWEHRVHYGQERDGYASLYWLTTLRDVTRVLRGEAEHPLAPERPRDQTATWRDAVVVDLLDAERDHPHVLWKLLLVVAFEERILEAARLLGTALEGVGDHDATRLAMGAFVASVVAVSRFEEIRESVRLVEVGLEARVMAMAGLRRRTRRARRRAPSGIVAHPPGPRTRARRMGASAARICGSNRTLHGRKPDGRGGKRRGSRRRLASTRR